MHSVFFLPSARTITKNQAGKLQSTRGKLSWLSINNAVSNLLPYLEQLLEFGWCADHGIISFLTSSIAHPIHVASAKRLPNRRGPGSFPLCTQATWGGGPQNGTAVIEPCYAEVSQLETPQPLFQHYSLSGHMPGPFTLESKAHRRQGRKAAVQQHTWHLARPSLAKENI